jgi:hypothetical protein
LDLEAVARFHAAQLCQRYLRFRDHGPICTALNLLTVLFYAAARLISRAGNRSRGEHQ